MILKNILIKYNYSSEYNLQTPYKIEEGHICYDDPLLKDTILDRTFKYANNTVLGMIEKFKNNFSSMFIKEHDYNGYTYYDKKNNKMMCDHFKLYDKNKKEVDYTDIFDEDILSKTKSVVSVIYKKINANRNCDEFDIYIADHKHEEDNTFGFPSVFNSVPGGRRDSSNPLSTFFSESYEELILGDKGIDFFDNACIKAYQLNENGALFIFCEVSPNATVNNVNDNIGQSGFKPFGLTVYKNHEEFLKKEKELTKDQLKQYKKENSYKVLIPREQGQFDSVSSSFEKINFDSDTLFGIPGRLDCYKKGSIVYNGIELLLKK